MKKIIQGVFALCLIALLFLPSPAPAQDQKGVEQDNAQEYRLVTDPPPFGSYYSLTLLQPPFPFNPFPELPVYELGKGMFVYDDRKVDYVALRAFQAAAASAAFVPGGGGGMAMMSGGPLPPYDVPGLKLTIPAFTNGYIYTTIFEHDPWLAYDIYSRTNLNSTNWLFGTWGVVGQTNYYLLQSGFPQNVFLIAASGVDSDGDGMPDNWEAMYGLNPNSAADATQDPDSDGLTNWQEFQQGSNPNGAPAFQVQISSPRIFLP